MITDDDKFYKKISGNTKRFRDGMTKAGFEIGGEGHPICPGLCNAFMGNMLGLIYVNGYFHFIVMLYEEKLAIDFAAAMLERGIYVIGFTFPVVPRGKARYGETTFYSAQNRPILILCLLSTPTICLGFACRYRPLTQNKT